MPEKQIRTKQSTTNQKADHKSVSLALQGGGTHGAFTWGVLDALLQEPKLNIAALSGSSAGAMNAVMLSCGLVKGGRVGARKALGAFWRDVSEMQQYSPLQPTVMEKTMSQWFGGSSLEYSPAFVWLDLLSRMTSPYQFNPANINPLKALIQRHLDVSAVQASQAPRLFVSATQVKTGKVRVFENAEVTPDVLMASACLPLLFQAVMIEGEAYWDGGYSGNPVLFPLVSSEPPAGQGMAGDLPSDIVIIQINPVYRAEVPDQARDILNRIHEMSFNSSLILEIEAINTVNKMLENPAISAVARTQGYRPVYLHTIDGTAALSPLGTASKFNADWAFMQQLFDEGQQAAEAWLRKNWNTLGEAQSALNLLASRSVSGSGALERA